MVETLSDTLSQEDRDEGLAFYKEEGVKEFIKKLKDAINDRLEVDANAFFSIIDELAGDKLV